MKITVNVTDKHIDTPRNPDQFRAHCCPIAQALLESGCTDVSVGPRYSYLHTNGKDYEGILPEVAARFVRHFDNWDGIGERKTSRPQPITFELELHPIRTQD